MDPESLVSVELNDGCSSTDITILCCEASSPHDSTLCVSCVSFFSGILWRLSKPISMWCSLAGTSKASNTEIQLYVLSSVSSTLCVSCVWFFFSGTLWRLSKPMETPMYVVQLSRDFQGFKHQDSTLCAFLCWEGVHGAGPDFYFLGGGMKAD